MLIEDQFLHSLIFFLKVSVKLPQKEYQHISPVEVQLMVVANLLIDPADVYLLPGDLIKYRILQVCL